METFVPDAARRMERGGAPRQVVEESFDKARRAVFGLAKEEGANVEDYAATLLTIVCANGMTAAAQVGDGAIIADGEILLEPDTGEYANETRFITSGNAEPKIAVLSGTVNRLAMITDGLQNIALDYSGERPAPYARFFDPLFQWLSAQDDKDEAKAQLQAFLDSPRVRKRTNDDLTLLMAVRAVE